MARQQDDSGDDASGEVEAIACGETFTYRGLLHRAELRLPSGVDASSDLVLARVLGGRDLGNHVYRSALQIRDIRRLLVAGAISTKQIGKTDDGDFSEAVDESSSAPSLPVRRHHNSEREGPKPKPHIERCISSRRSALETSSNHAGEQARTRTEGRIRSHAVWFSAPQGPNK